MSWTPGSQPDNVLDDEKISGHFLSIFFGSVFHIHVNNKAPEVNIHIQANFDITIITERRNQLLLVKLKTEQSEISTVHCRGALEVLLSCR